MIKLNLKPKLYTPPKKVKRAVEINLRGPVLISLIVIIILVFISAYEILKQNRIKSEIKEIEAKKQALVKEVEMVEKLESAKEALRKKIRAIEKVDKNRDYWIKLFETIEKCVPESTWLNSLEQTNITIKVVDMTKAALEKQQKQAPARRRGEQPQATTETQLAKPGVLIEAITKDKKFITSFISSLEQTPIFEKVELQSISPVFYAERNYLLFKIGAIFSTESAQTKEEEKSKTPAQQSKG